MTSDAELLAAWQAGDRKAGGELIDRHFEDVRRFFLNKVADVADDLIQQTFLALVQQRAQIRDGEAGRAAGRARALLLRERARPRPRARARAARRHRAEA